MQLSWSLLGLVVVLLVINLAIYGIRKYLIKRKRMSAVALTRDLILVRNAEKFGLSERETEVVRLILAGLTYKEVGEKLFISEKTVDSHMQNIYPKVGVKNKLSLLNKLYAA